MSATRIELPSGERDVCVLTTLRTVLPRDEVTAILRQCYGQRVERIRHNGANVVTLQAWATKQRHARENGT